MYYQCFVSKLKRLACLLIVLMTIFGACGAEEPEDNVVLYVVVDLLNGRDRPNRHGTKEAMFDYGDSLTPTGRWSADHNWIEVYGGESGTVWVCAKYVSEIAGSFYVENLDYSQVKIRKRPIDGRLTGYLKRGKALLIDQVVLGWGHCSKGWIDLSLVAEVIGGD